MYVYKVAKVLKVVDGDTFDFAVDLGFNIIVSLRFRLIGVDTPEIYRPKSDAEYELGIKAKEFVEHAFANSTAIQIQSEKDPGVYGRWACSVFYDYLDPETKTIHPGRNLTEYLTKEKLTKKYI